MKAFIILAVVMLLAGCVGRTVIADLEQDKVIVFASGNVSIEEIKKKAEEGCAMHGRHASPVSRNCLDNYCIRANYLFACIK